MLKWIAAPITYTTKTGTGLVVGQYHYRYDKTGQLTYASEIKAAEMSILLKQLYGADAAAHAAAGLRTVREVDDGFVQEDG